MKKIHEMYLDWWNNFLSVERFAEYYNISEQRANRIIIAGRYIHDKQFAETMNNDLENAKQIMRDNGYILGALWSKQDILNQLNQLDFDDKISDKLKSEIVNLTADHLEKVDCNVGINWHTIEVTMWYVMDELGITYK